MRATIIPLLALASLGAAADDDAVSIGHLGNRLVITAPTGASEVDLGARMSQHLTVDFVDTPLSEVVDFLRKVTDANVVIDPKVLAAEPAITLKASDMELGAVLHWVTVMAKVNVGFVDGAIYLSQEPYKGHERTVMYDVSDLVTPTQRFPGPDLDIPEPGGQGAKLLPPVEPEQPPSSVDELEQVLRTVVLHEK
jgi:hypothetical protein